MSLPIEQFQLDSSSQYKIWENQNGGTEQDLCFVGFSSEPNSVLDSVRSPSPFVSSSTTTTLSSSHGGPIGGAFSGADGKCNQMGFEDLDGVLDSSPGQEQSILRLIMSGGDVLDPDSSGFMGFNPGSGSEPVLDDPNPLFGYSFPFLEDDEKFQTLTNPNPGFVPLRSDPPLSPPSKRLNSGQPGYQCIPTNPNPGFVSVGSNPPLSPPSKRLNSGQPGSQWISPTPKTGHFSVGSSPIIPGQPGSVPGQDPFIPPPKLDDTSSRVIIDQLFNAAAELTGGDSNNLVIAQSILARLNHNLLNINPKPPFQRAALYITLALQSLLLQGSSPHSPQTLILRIAAYKAYSETSPFLPFVDFTANQTIIESLEGFDRIHIVDFDIGFGSQWSSLIQELGLRRKGSVSLKVTAFVSPSTVFDEFEVRFTEENLRSFAGEVGVSFEIEFLNMDTLLNSSSWSVLEKEGIAVNLPISSVVSGYVPLILQFLKRISPNVVVCSDRSCDRNNDEPFPNGVINALQYYTSLLESLESGNANTQEVGLSIERFFVQPSIEKLLTNRYRWMEKSLPWRSLFGQCGFSQVMLSQMVETQGEYLLQRSPMRGFHLEKTQSSLVLCWQRKELVAVSAWRCSRDN